MKTGESNVYRENENGDHCHFARGFSDAVLSGCREDGNLSGSLFPFATRKSPAHTQEDSIVEGGGKPGIHKILSSIGKKTMQWSGKGTDQESSEPKSNQFGWPSIQGRQDSTRPEIHIEHYNRPVANEASGSSFSFNVSSSSCESSCENGSGSGSALHKLDVETDISDYEIMWKDLQVGEQIERGCRY